MDLPTSVTIRGKRWQLRRVRSSQMEFRGDNPQGECDPPDKPSKEIRVLKTLANQKLLEVLLHEMLHAALWDLDETAIDQTAHDIARELWKMGYRRDPE